MNNKSLSYKRLKRSESFLGVHFDFHASEDCTDIGKNTTREMIETILKRVKPDYVQCDCKGHPGYSSYPTKVGHPAPGIAADALRIWREVTAENGVSLYMHYSGVWDNQAVRHHPDWARINGNGQQDDRLNSTFSPYVDELLIPQLKELIDEYGVDGVWVDGDCWATEADWSEKAVHAYRQETGIQEIPRQPGDPFYLEYKEFCREQFRRYLRHYVDEIHQHNPDFEIASNWAYTSFMPEPVTVGVDYISGDFTLQDSVNSARLEGRCMARQGKPWDLMAWGFSQRVGAAPGLKPEHASCTKGPAQLMQEAAVVLALGGGFQAYFTQKRDGSVRLWQMNVMAEVAEFCRKRQAICHRAEAVPQVGLLYSGPAFYRNNQKLFGAWHGELEPMKGVLQSLINSQYSVEILSEHHLTGRLGGYPLIIIPEWGYLEPEFREELLDYVRKGGKLLLIGPEPAALFAVELGIEFTGELEERKAQWLEHNGRLAGYSNNLFRPVRLKEGAQAFGRLYPDNDPTGAANIAASVAAYGQGKIAATYFNYGERYLHAANYVARDFLNDLVRLLFPRPMVEVAGSHEVDVTVNRSAGKLAVNLVNTAGPHANPNIFTFDEIPPLGPLEVTIRCGSKPSKVTLEPEGQELACVYEAGEVRLTLPRLGIHSAIVLV